MVPNAARSGVGMLGVGLVLFVAVWLPVRLAADETPAPPATAAPVAPVAPERPRLLVMKDGSLVRGRIDQEAGGYVVQKGGGRYVVPYELVLFPAVDEQDAYRKLKASVQQPSARTCVTLAKWCLTWQLHKEAESELRAALEHDPSHAEARRMLVQLATLLDPQGQPPKLPDPEPKTDDGFQPLPARSLAGLSRDNAAAFTRKIQPILVNRCGNAGCHGGDVDNGFKLLHVRAGSGSHRVRVEKNLAAVLAQIDPDQPDRSPLVALPVGLHGSGSRPVFDGLGGTQNLADLRQWVRDVAVDLGGDPSKRVVSPAVLASNAEQPEPQRFTLIRGSADEPPADPATAKPSETDRVLEAALLNERGDAFDPEEFNREHRAAAVR
jgi:hypothetical protein